jgi:ribose transport system permease protein
MGERRSLLGRLPSEYGIALVLVVLCVVFSVATLTEQQPEGATAGEELARTIAAEYGAGAKVVVVAGPGRADREFADALDAGLRQAGLTVAARSAGHPSDARTALADLPKQGVRPDVIAASSSAGRWTLLEGVGEKVPGLGNPRVMAPTARRWPSFLNADNLLNVANQIAVIAILAVGMTLVIITGGIDLSVGSLIALSAVLAALLIRRYAGAEQATAAGMVACCLAAILACGVVGGLSGLVVTQFAVPSFIVTLGMMLMASGAAFLLTAGESVSELPASFVWLGRGADLAGVPNAVVLMAVLYVAAHLVLTRTTFGRYVYAVGGNAEAARLAGVRVSAVVVLVFALNGLLAGLGGVVMASQLRSGSPNYGQMYELYVIAAVVVGGTSLSGGEGNVLGTLLGAFLIAVIQNGMNLTGVESYTQKVVLGAIIVAAVLLDRLKLRFR